MKIKSGKIDRIPSQYSDELFKQIQLMMHLEKEVRPSVEDLMQHPKISHHIKEQNMRDLVTSTKRKEEELVKKEKLIKEKEAEIER